MTHVPANYHECKLQVVAMMPGSLSSFLYAYCKTVNAPESVEPHFIRKTISFVKLSRYIRTHITNDFDAWFRQNQNSHVLCEVVANIINAEESRTELYGAPAINEKWISPAFYSESFGFEIVLVQK